MSLFVIAAVVYFFWSFYRFHLVAYTEKNIADAIDQLKAGYST